MMLKKIASLFFIFILLCLVTTLFSADILNAAYHSEFIAYQHPSKKGDTFVTLKNGLTVFIRRTTVSNVLSARIMVKAGSIYEPPLSGLSHYLEHVVSGGSTREFSEEEARKILEKLGGATNASTSYNTTQYYITTSSKFWRDAVNLLLSYVHDCSFNPREVEREKGVILQEFNLGENSPSRQLWYLFFETAYTKHPVRYPVIGRKEIFAKQTRDNLINYYKKIYQPSRMVLVVVGNVNPENLLSFVIEKTKNWEDKPFAEPSFPAEPIPATPRKVVKRIRFLKQPRAMIGFPSVSLFNEDMYALDVLAYILGGYKTSRLVEQVKEKLNLVTSISAFNWTPSFTHGQFIISVAYNPGKWKETLSAIRQTISQIKNKGIKASELEKVKKQVIANHIFGNETASEQSSSLASSFIETGDPYFDDAYVENIKEIKVEDVIRVARKYLNWNHVVIARVLPYKETKKESRNINNHSKQNNIKPHIEVLPNGLKAIICKYGHLPIVTVQLYGIGGQLIEPENKAGIAHLTASLLKSGTKKHSRNQIIDAIESIGGEIDTGSGRNTYYVSIDVLKEDLDIAIDVLSEILTSSIFPENEVKKEKFNTLSAIKRAKENWQRELILLFHQNYFNSHPYKRSILGTTESISSITRKDIVNFFKNTVIPNKAVIAIYGDVDIARTSKILKRKLGLWRKEVKKQVTIKVPREVRPDSIGKTISIKNKKSASGIFIGTAGIDIYDKRRPVLDILDAVLSGIQYPSGRLYEALRGGSNNLVYVIHAFPFYGINAGYFGVIAQTSPEKLSKVKAIIFDKLKEISEKPISRGELEEAKNMIMTMKHISMESTEAQASNAAINELLGLGWNYDQKYYKALKEIVPEDVLKTARELFKYWLTIQTVPENFRSSPAK